MSDDRPAATIGVIGGSGFSALFDDGAATSRSRVDTPFGPPSAPLTVGQVAGRGVAFLPATWCAAPDPAASGELPGEPLGLAHRWASARCSARARSVRCGPSSGRARSSSPTRWSTAPGAGPTPCTTSRASSSTSPSPIRTAHMDGKSLLAQANSDRLAGRERDGTLVVINGPRFSSRAESRWHAAAGWTVVGMTGMPEASIARELALCYTSLCLVTDHDAGVEGEVAVTHAEVLEVFARNVERLKALIARRRTRPARATTRTASAGTRSTGCPCRSTCREPVPGGRLQDLVLRLRGGSRATAAAPADRAAAAPVRRAGGRSHGGGPPPARARAAGTACRSSSPRATSAPAAS